jgi:hypothetical protein
MIEFLAIAVGLFVPSLAALTPRRPRLIVRHAPRPALPPTPLESLLDRLKAREVCP